MAVLTGHRPLIAGLPKEPFQRFLSQDRIGGHETSGFLGQIEHDRAAFEDRNGRPFDIVVDDGGHTIVGADFQEIGRELIALGDVQDVGLVGQAQFFEKDRDLPAVRRRPIVKVDHLSVP